MHKGLYFLAGLAIGSLATFFGVKEYFKALAEDEISSVKENFRKEKEAEKQTAEVKMASEAAKMAKEKPSLVSYSDILKRARYYSNKAAVSPPTEHPDHPYSISPEEFVKMNGYEKITLTYFENEEVLVKEDLEDEDDISRIYPHDTIGDDFLTGMGQYEDGVGYFRNDELGCDYEVVSEFRSYKDVYPDADFGEEQ